MRKNSLLLTESERKSILEMHKVAIKQVLSEQEVRQGGKGDPYQYKKEGNKYYYANKSEGLTPNWKEQTNPKGIEAICTRVFGEPAGCSTNSGGVGGQQNLGTQQSTTGGVDSGVAAGGQTIIDGVSVSSFGANCTKITVIGSFAAKVTSNPANITNFINKVKTELQNNPAVSKDFASGKAYIAGIKLIGGASNKYSKVVKPEMDNNYNVQSYPDNASYSASDGPKNKALAVQRANGLYAELQTQLPAINLNFGPNVTPEVVGYTVDTGGKVDSTRDTSKYKNPGQVVIVQMDICSASPAGTSTTPIDPIGGKVPNNIDEFKKLGRDGFVLSGAYFCNGKNSLDSGANANTFDSCNQVQLTADKAKKSVDSHMSAYEIKYKLNVNGDPWVRPVVRWKIYWDANNKITKVLQQQVDKQFDPAGIFPSKQIDANDEFFKLALKNGKPDAPDTRFDKFIKPYL
jgi:hypothetical protein